MTTIANSRLAGSAYLLYIAAGIGSMAAARRPEVRGVLTALIPFCAIALGVTLYTLTRAVDRDLALLAMACRLVEASGAANNELFFAAGSTIFCALLWIGRLIPAPLAGARRALVRFPGRATHAAGGGHVRGKDELAVANHVGDLAAAAGLRAGVCRMAVDARRARPGR